MWRLGPPSPLPSQEKLLHPPFISAIPAPNLGKQLLLTSSPRPVAFSASSQKAVAVEIGSFWQIHRRSPDSTDSVVHMSWVCWVCWQRQATSTLPVFLMRLSNSPFCRLCKENSSKTEATRVLSDSLATSDGHCGRGVSECLRRRRKKEGKMGRTSAL